MTDRQGRTNTERFPHRKNEQGKHICRVCQKELTGRKTSFCNQRCLRDFYMLTDWQRVREVIYIRDGGICMECGKRLTKRGYHVDHICPVSKGGAEWDLSNLELNCPSCNLKKGAKYEEDN